MICKLLNSNYSFKITHKTLFTFEKLGYELLHGSKHILLRKNGKIKFVVNKGV